MFKQFNQSVQPDFYDVEVESEAECKPIENIKPCPSCDVLLVGTNEGNPFIANIQHHLGESFTFNRLRYSITSFANSENANDIAEIVLQGKPRKVIVLTSQPSYVLESKQDTLKILSTEVKSTLLPPNFIDGTAAAFFNVSKHLKIPVTVYIAFHSNFQPSYSTSRYDLKSGVYTLLKNVEELPKFEYKNVQQSSMYT